MSIKTLIHAGKLWDGVNDQPKDHFGLIIENGVIQGVDDWNKIKETPHDKLLDWSAYTAMPGLIDAHTHLSMDPTLENYLDHMTDSVDILRKRAHKMMKIDLKAGITTCRCLGDKEFLDIECKEQVAKGNLFGPRLQVASRGIKAGKGHGFVGYPFDGEDAIVNAIKENVEKGADLTKIYITGTLKGDGNLPSYLTYNEIKRAIETSHNLDTPVASHCVGGVGLDWALDLGLDTIEHVYHITKPQIEKLAQSDTWLVLTPGPILTSLRVQHLPEHLIQGHIDEKAMIKENMANTIAAGFPFAVGTDGMHGDLYQEVLYLQEMGASNHVALMAATSNAAKACSIYNETGSLENGKFADIAVIDGNPFDTLSALKSVVAVMKEGELVHENNLIN